MSGIKLLNPLLALTGDNWSFVSSKERNKTTNNNKEITNNNARFVILNFHRPSAPKVI
jgi:hypothetical protein